MVAHWDESPEDWDTCLLGNFRLPGVATVEVTNGRKIDKKSAAGKNGATITDKGGEGAEVTITLQMVGADAWDVWCGMLKIINPRRTAPQAWALGHPEAEANEIASVVIEKITSSKPENGIKTIKIQCTEWFPMAKTTKSKVVTPGAAKGPPNVLDMARDKNVARVAAAHNQASGGHAGPPPPPSATGNSPGG